MLTLHHKPAGGRYWELHSAVLWRQAGGKVMLG